jgi:2-polyprenyl-3-methyl-5-hydroxy-6-metoxy-1,4-benzoquinol methylase
MSLHDRARIRPTNGEIRAYWDTRIHDTVLSNDPPGTPGFYAAMDAYRYGRLEYLSSLVDFDRWRDRDVLDLGCGAGLDLVRFARAGARVVGVDLSHRPLSMAETYLAVSGVEARLVQGDAANLPLADDSYDLVFCHGVLSFVGDDTAVVREIRRILRPNGMAILMVYNRRSAMYAAHRLLGLPLGHADAPGFHTHTRAEFARLVEPLAAGEVLYERLPGTTSRPRGPGARLLSAGAQTAARVLPRSWFMTTGWHMLAVCRKQGASSFAPSVHFSVPLRVEGQE